MLRICALNESSSEEETENEHDQVNIAPDSTYLISSSPPLQVETKEAQEAHLLDLYNQALQVAGILLLLVK